MNAAGEVVNVYRKLHLFDVDTPEFKFRESSCVKEGPFLTEPLNNTPLGDGLGLLIVSIHLNSNIYSIFLMTQTLYSPIFVYFFFLASVMTYVFLK